MEGLKSDNAKSETSFAMKDIFRMYTIKDCQSEPHYQHQNPIEQHIQDLKHMMHSIMDHVALFLVVVSFVCHWIVQCSQQLQRLYSLNCHHWH